jgi:hypothetical protein
MEETETQEYRILIKQNDTVSEIVMVSDKEPTIGTTGTLLDQQYEIVDVLTEEEE